MMRCLVELGARIGAVSDLDNSALLVSALFGRYETMPYLLEDAGANIDDVNTGGETVWGLLTDHLTAIAEGRETARDRRDLLSERLEEEEVAESRAETDLVALPGLLRVMVLRGAPPSALHGDPTVARASLARVVREGARLRARLSTYLVRRQALMLLPPFRALVHAYCPIEREWRGKISTSSFLLLLLT
jgi:hypothetical protein